MRIFIMLLLMTESIYAAELFIKPILICNDQGMECADTKTYEKETEKVWKQAAIDIKFLEWSKINKTEYLDLSLEEADQLLKYTSTTPGKVIINTFYVKKLHEENVGMALGKGKKHAIIVTDEQRPLTLAHEIGHVLGLGHGCKSGDAT